MELGFVSAILAELSLDDVLAFAAAEGVLPAADDAAAIARFLRTCPGLDRALVGIFLSEPDEPKYRLNAAVRAEFAAQFDFRACRVDMGLRVFLESFRLPGEAQKIERLMQVRRAAPRRAARGEQACALTAFPPPFRRPSRTVSSSSLRAPCARPIRRSCSRTASSCSTRTCTTSRSRRR